MYEEQEQLSLLTATWLRGGIVSFGFMEELLVTNEVWEHLNGNTTRAMRSLWHVGRIIKFPVIAVCLNDYSHTFAIVCILGNSIGSYFTIAGIITASMACPYTFSAVGSIGIEYECARLLIIVVF